MTSEPSAPRAPPPPPSLGPMTPPPPDGPQPCTTGTQQHLHRHHVAVSSHRLTCTPLPHYFAPQDSRSGPGKRHFPIDRVRAPPAFWVKEGVGAPNANAVFGSPPVDGLTPKRTHDIGHGDAVL